MDHLFDSIGVWLARAYGAYGIAFLLLPLVSFAYLGLLLLLIWSTVTAARGKVLWPRVPQRLRSSVRLGIEIVFGLLNPVLYLAILTPSLLWLRSDSAWFQVLTAAAWALLTLFWLTRLFGSAVDSAVPTVRAGVHALLILSFACLVAYTIKDAAILLFGISAGVPHQVFLASTQAILRAGPFYLIPLLLLWRHLRAWSAPAAAKERAALFLLPGRASRLAVACGVAVAILTIGSATHRRSDAAAHALVEQQRDAIREAAAQYDVDARLIAAIIYVTNREQIAPFRAELERIVMAAWGEDGGDMYGGNQMLLDKGLDLSVGLTQIKPRTALTASLMATGRTPDDLPQPAMFTYRNAEPRPALWTSIDPPGAAPPFPVPATRAAVVNALLDARLNIATCAMILALYQKQWADRDFSLRHRPDILATLYQIGFARSQPHPAPESNDFGRRVGEVVNEPWLNDLFTSVGR